MADEVLKAKVGVDLKGGATGELSLGQHFPGLIERFLPWARRASIDHALAVRILQKLEKGERITRADADFAEAKFGEAAGTYIRRIEIAGRTVEALTDKSLPALPAPQCADASTSPGATADEWIRRFWDDAGSVSDEVLQEIYARLLASEVQTQGSVSTRTLQVLRYLDHASAEAFARVLPQVVNGTFLPRGRGILDVSFGVLLELDEAGLVDSSSTLNWQVEGPNRYLGWGHYVFELTCEGPTWHGSSHYIPAYPLTRAGRELARVARVVRDAGYFDRLCRWLDAELPPTATMRVAEAPTGWSGDPQQLTWKSLERTTAP